MVEVRQFQQMIQLAGQLLNCSHLDSRQYLGLAGFSGKLMKSQPWRAQQ